MAEHERKSKYANPREVSRGGLVDDNDHGNPEDDPGTTPLEQLHEHERPHASQTPQEMHRGGPLPDQKK